VDEVHDLFAPSAESVAAVRAWLQEAGIAEDRVSHSVNKQWIQFDAQTHEAEELLKTKFHFYEHSRNGRTSLGCDECAHL
jgi:tripeptidyl-peptidase-1